MENYRNAYVTMVIVALNVLMFIEGFFFGDDLTAFGALIASRVINNQEFYRIVTAMFLHAGPQHIMSNMLMLVVVGCIIENYMGHALYAIMYMSCGIIGNVSSIAYETLKGLAWISVGASGAIMGVVGYMVIWFAVNRQMFKKNKSLLIRLICLAIFLIEACFFQTGANTVAHLGGLLTGMVFGLVNIVGFKNIKDMEGI
jgi:rhomboid protease GluP